MQDCRARMFYRRAMLLAVMAVAALPIATTAHAAAPTVSPDSLSFSAPPGQTDVDTVVVTNDTDGPLLVTIGSAAPPFEATDDCDAVPARGECTITVTYAPTARGPHTETLTISSRGTDSSGAEDQTVLLTGTVGPLAGVAPNLLSFSAAFGATSAPQRVTLTNIGDQPLGGTAPALIGPNFTIVASTCGGDLAPDESCTADVAFTAPQAGGTSEAVLRFSTNASADPARDVGLSGTAFAPGTQPPRPSLPPSPPPQGGSSDRDGDGVLDNVENCPRVAGDLKNGCPSELNADVVGRWRVNNLRSQLLSLIVRAPVGSRIELRCGGRPRLCPFRERTVGATTQRTTGLTKHFKGRRILRAHVVITVRVTRPQQIGTYERLKMRTGRRLPQVTQRCIGPGTGRVRSCPS